MQASVIVTTPEKWDAVSRSWQTRSFVQVIFIFNPSNLGLENLIWTKTGQKSCWINRWHHARCLSHYASQCYCNYPGKMGCSISILANSKLRSGILYFLLGQNNNKLFARGDINSYETLHLLIALLITPRNKSGVRITV